MIEESYVSLETAKMLKEAGFRELTKTHYSNSGEVWQSSAPEDYNDDNSCKACSRPTQALAARWIREVHNLHIYAIQTNLSLTETQTDKWEWGYIIVRVDDPNGGTVCDINYPDYETALEEGLQRGLELIKK